MREAEDQEAVGLACHGPVDAPSHRIARRRSRSRKRETTLRQRVSRLARETLASSKNVANHIGARRYFICDDNLTRAEEVDLAVETLEEHQEVKTLIANLWRLEPSGT